MASEHIFEFTDNDFSMEVEKAEKLTIVDFWAEWCGPCLMFAPTLEDLAKEYSGKVKIGKLNVDNARNTAVKFGIRSIPTIMFFKDGEVVNRLIGVQSKSKVEAVIKEHI